MTDQHDAQSRLLTLESDADIPTFANEDEEHEFWATHTFGDRLLEEFGPPPPGLLPPASRLGNRPALIEIDTLGDIPEFATEREEADFWATHAFSERYFNLVGETTDHGLPPTRPRTTPLAVRFDEATLTRLRALAAIKKKGYQTLPKEFVCERLYEEEKREGIIPS